MAKKSQKTVVYSALEVANICGVVNQTVINWIKKDYLSAFLTPGNQYRVYQDDLIAFMNSRNMRIPEELLETSLQGKNAKNLSLLVIEDEKGLNIVLAKNFEREFPSFKITSAFDSFEAGMILAEKSTDIVIVDLDVAGIDGIELCRKIVQTEMFGHPVVVAIAKDLNSETEKKLKEIGVENAFQKPINLIELNECLTKIL